MIFFEVLWSLLILGVIVLGVGALLLVLTITLMASMLLRPPRMSDGKAAAVLRRISPGDLDLHFEEMRFEVRNDRERNTIHIAGWWIAHPDARGKCVVLIHGYSDAKVGAIAWAPMWHSLGCNILAIDLRAHGQSDGKHSTAGYFERRDVNAVLNEVLADRADEAQRIVLFGVSLGAAVALGVAEMREDISALVLECPYADYDHAVDAHARIMQMPLPSLAPLAVRLAEWFSRADFGAVRPIDLLDRVNSPTMVIGAADDPFVEHKDAEAIEQIMRRRGERGIPSTYWRVAGAGHVMGIAADAEAYRRRILEFLERSASREIEHRTSNIEHRTLKDKFDVGR